MGSSVGSVGSDESSGGVATTLGTGLLVIACTVLVIVHAVLLVLLLLVISLAIAAYLLNHTAGALSRV